MCSRRWVMGLRKAKARRAGERARREAALMQHRHDRAWSLGPCLLRSSRAITRLQTNGERRVSVCGRCGGAVGKSSGGVHQVNATLSDDGREMSRPDRVEHVAEAARSGRSRERPAPGLRMSRQRTPGTVEVATSLERAGGIAAIRGASQTSSHRACRRTLRADAGHSEMAQSTRDVRVVAAISRALVVPARRGSSTRRYRSALAGCHPCRTSARRRAGIRRRAAPGGQTAVTVFVSCSQTSRRVRARARPAAARRVADRVTFR